MIQHIFDKSPTTFGVQPLLYLDAADINYRVLNGGNVSDALDKSGNGNNFSQPTPANQPILLEEGQNGLDVWTGDLLSARYLEYLIVFPVEYTLFLVADRETHYPAVYLTNGNGASGTPAILSNSNPGVGVRAFEWFDHPIRRTFSINATGYHVLAVTHDDRFAPKITRGYFDGLEVFYASSITGLGGRAFQRILYYWGVCQSHIGQVEIFPKVFTNLEIAAHTQYLKNKWGIS